MLLAYPRVQPEPCCYNLVSRQILVSLHDQPSSLHEVAPPHEALPQSRWEMIVREEKSLKANQFARECALHSARPQKGTPPN